MLWFWVIWGLIVSDVMLCNYFHVVFLFQNLSSVFIKNNKFFIENLKNYLSNASDVKEVQTLISKNYL